MHKYNIINLECRKEISTKTGTVKSIYDSYLVEYCIRKKYLQNTDDKFTTFLDLFKRVFPCKKKNPFKGSTIKSTHPIDVFD